VANRLGWHMRAFVGAMALVLVGLGGGMLGPSGPAAATTNLTLYVSTAGSGTTCTASTPCATIQGAVTTAETDFPGDAMTIHVMAGTYTEHTVAITASSLVSLDIQGAGAWKTIVSGTTRGRVFDITGATVSITGLSIIHGKPTTDKGGGGVYNDGGRITLTDDTLSEDHTTTTGGYGGGGALLNTGTATLTDDTFLHDTTTAFGGAVLNTGTVTLTHDTLLGDSATFTGGGVYTGGTATLTDDTLLGDSAEEGGGVMSLGTATLTDDTISGNGVTFYGGGVYIQGHATLIDDTISVDAASRGGGLYDGDGVITLTDDTISQDHANTYGGGIYNIEGTITLTDDTLSGDTATSTGGGVDSLFSTETVANSLYDTVTCTTDGNTVTASSGYNVVTSTTCQLGTHNLYTTASAINLQSLAANTSRGPETMAIGTTSSAFGEVPRADCFVRTDERGEPRPGVSGDNCDAGAYEYESQSVPPVTYLTVPSAPRALTAVPGNHQATITWLAPVTTGGSAITSYTVTSTTGTHTCSPVSLGHLGCTVKGLTDGVSYDFTVVAHNAIGTSPPSTPSNVVVPAEAPGKPTKVVAKGGDAKATVTWVAPTTGGSPITSYVVTSAPTGKTCTWTTGPLTCTVTGLTNGKAYTFKVRASNTVATSPTSTSSNPVTPEAGAPAEPTAPTATPGNKDATITWEAPTTDGSAITKYTVTSSTGKKTCIWTSGPLTCTVKGLTNGIPYTFTLVAKNAKGTSSASTPSNSVTPEAVVSARPKAPTAIAGNASATVKWTKPTTGGSTITSYTVTSTTGDHSCSWTKGSLTCKVTGLTNGHAYKFRVVARNAAGTSTPSTYSKAVTPKA
jgi:hypothetical protein